MPISIWIIAIACVFLLRGDSVPRHPWGRDDSLEPNSPPPDSPPNETEAPARLSFYPDGGLVRDLRLYPDGGVADSYVSTLTPAEAVQRLTRGVCDSLVPCRDGRPGQTEEACEAALNEGELNRFFGLHESIRFSRIARSEVGGLIVNNEALERCLQGMTELSCEQVAEEDRRGEELEREMQAISEELRREALAAGEEWVEEEEPEEAPQFSLDPIAFHDAEALDSCRQVFDREPVTCSSESSVANAAPLHRIVSSLCSRMATCQPDLACDACVAGVMGSDIALNFGLPQGGLGGIEWGLGTGLYSANPEALERCLADLSAISCGRAGDAWNIRRSEPSRSLRSITRLPGSGSCSEVFSAPRVSCDPPGADPASRIAAGLCSSLSTCHPALDCDACITGVLTTRGLADNFGWGTRTMTLRQLSEALSRREARVSEGELDQCLPRLAAQACSGLVNNWSERRPRSFRMMERMIPGRESPCRRVFGE